METCTLHALFTDLCWTQMEKKKIGTLFLHNITHMFYSATDVMCILRCNSQTEKHGSHALCAH